jgi:hypothetical protein
MDTELLIQKINELKQKPQLNRHERRYLIKLENKLHSPKISSNKQWRSALTKFLIVFGVLLFIVGLYWYIKSLPYLPPIDMAGHKEENPSSHIVDKAMPEYIQKHMLEHADGKGKPGVLIQYNCSSPYTCEPGLIDRLKNLIKKYPENVYLTPGNYDGVIILTKLNKREILSSFNEAKIIKFIKNE